MKNTCLWDDIIHQGAEGSALFAMMFYSVLMDGVNPSPTIGDSLPVEKVNWHDAAYYCNQRSKRDSLDTVYTYESLLGTPGLACTLVNVKVLLGTKGYRLPSEAEWEYACRGGTATQVYWDTTFVSPLTDSCAWHWKIAEQVL